ncbi:MAG: hypothetical protein KF850_03975 [Labilithrix sp.]|nr:hypothetical protein [Labilithrix sp.]
MKFRGYRAFPNGDIDDLVAKELVPSLADAEFFFVRWSQPRPHLRLRIAATIAPDWRRGASFIVERACYRPDSHRVGGPRAIDSAHALDVASSKLVCALLAEEIPRPAAALLAGAILVGALVKAEHRLVLLDDFATGMASMLEIDGARLTRFRGAVEESVEGAMSRHRELLDGVFAFDDTRLDEALVPLHVSARAAEAALRHLPVVRRWRISMRHLHNLHNRLGLGGLTELDAILRLRRTLEMMS